MGKPNLTGRIRKLFGMNSAIGRAFRNDRGSMAVFAAVTLSMSIAFAAFTVDIGNGFVMRSRLQATADAAALAGLMELPEGATTLKNSDSADVVAAAQAFSIANMATASNGTVLENKDVLIGHWDGTGKYGIARTFYVDGTMPEDAIYNAVQVSTRRSDENGNPLTLLFPGFLGLADIGVSAVSIAAHDVAGLGDGCVIALRTGERLGIGINGTAQVHLGCSIVSNSPIRQGGNSCLWTTGISAMGSIDETCLINPDDPEGVVALYRDRPYEIVDPLCTVPADPYKCLKEPVAVPGECGGNVNVTVGPDSDADAVVPLTPGVYCGDLRIQGTAYFEPGLYHIIGGKFLINSGADVTGYGVTFFLDSSDKNDIFEINGHSLVSLHAPTETDVVTYGLVADYTGVLFFQTREELLSVHKFNGGAEMDLDGIIYTPSAEVQFNGGSDATLNETNLDDTREEGLMIIAGTVDFIGTTNITDSAMFSSARDNPFLQPVITVHLVQ